MSNLFSTLSGQQQIQLDKWELPPLLGSLALLHSCGVALATGQRVLLAWQSLLQSSVHC